MKRLLFFILIINIYFDSNSQKPYSIPSDTLQVGYTSSKGKIKLYLDVNGNTIFDGTKNKRIKFLDTSYFDKEVIGLTLNTFSSINSYFLGKNSGENNLTGFDNVFIGGRSGKQNTIGYNNLFIGSDAGVLNTEGSYNIFIGDSSGKQNTTGYENLFIGSDAGGSITTQIENTFIGLWAGQTATTNQSTFIGYGSGNGVTIDSSTFIGYKAGEFNQAGFGNTFIGTIAGSKNVVGNNSTYIGFKAGASAESDSNVFVGCRSGYKTTTGHNNTFIGNYSGYENISGSNNVFVGNNSGKNTDIGGDNIFIGSQAGYKNDNNNLGIFIGTKAGFYNNAENNIFIGYNSGINNVTGLSNLFNGHSSGYSNVDGSYNLFLGENSGYNNVSGDKNTLIGYYSGLNSTGDLNIAVGYSSGSDIGALSKRLCISSTGIDSTKYMIWGFQDADPSKQILTLNTKLITNTASTSAIRGTELYQNTADALGVRLAFYKSRGTYSNPSTITTGDTLMRLESYGFAQTAYRLSSSIYGLSTGTIATGRCGGIITFNTAIDAAAGTLTERSRIDQAGRHFIGPNGATIMNTTASNFPYLQIQSANTYYFADFITSGLAHGMTTLAPTNVAGQIQTNANGQLAFQAYTDATAAIAALGFNGIHGGTPSGAVMYFSSSKKSGTTRGALADGEMAFSFRNVTAEKLNIYGNGDTKWTGQNDITIGTLRQQTAATAGKNVTFAIGGAVTGGTNLGGGMLAFGAGISTGSATSSIRSYRVTRDAAATTDNIRVEAEILPSEKTLVDNVATGLFTVALPQTASLNYVGGTIYYQVFAFSAAGDSISGHSGSVKFAACQTAAGYQTSIVDEAVTESADIETHAALTLTESWTITTGSNIITVNATFDSSIGIVTLKCYYKVLIGGRVPVGNVTQL